MANDQNWLIDHTGIGVADVIVSSRFYEAALLALGIKALVRIDRNRKPVDGKEAELAGVGFGVDYPTFWIDIFHPHSVRQHTAFRANSRQQVDEFYEAALRAGGTDNGGPSLRTGGYPPGYYAAFVLDPDGNNMEAVFRE